ncbi:hypothetical protein U9M48_007998 [Paspalum notatum var. saurae]|uniref:Uncharacterized protein n=1 Tax=Paspalum notatum var. saurae TaxID=547442 RepID=A0AAQ3SNL5_PASNO
MSSSKSTHRRRKTASRNVWPITNVIKNITATTMLCPADLISNGQISAGTKKVRGPHDQAKPATNTHIVINTRIAATVNCEMIICTPPTRKSFLRPNLSTSIIATMLANVAQRRVTTDEKRDALSSRPIVLNTTGISSATTSCGLYFLLNIFLNGYWVALERLLAETKSSSSFWTEVVPRSFWSRILALSVSPSRWIMKLGVSGRKTAPMVRNAAGSAAMDRDILHPHPADVCKENAKADAKLKAIVDCPTVSRWCHFRQPYRPIPSRILLRSSMGILMAAPPNTEPAMKIAPPISIDVRRPYLLVTDAATRVATRPAM